MRIREYRKSIGLSLDQIRERFGKPSTYRDSKNAIMVLGKGVNGKIVMGTMVISEDCGDLVIFSIRAMESGAGTMMVKKICDFADEFSQPIVDLNPSPYPISVHSKGVRKKRKKELVLFYEKFGFKMGADKKMSREPFCLHNK